MATWVKMSVVAALVLASCSLGGGIDGARWWIVRGETIGPSTTSFDVLVGWSSCVNDPVTLEDIEGYTVEYEEDSVAVAVSLRLPGGFIRSGCPSTSGQDPVLTIELEEPLGDRVLMEQRGDRTVREAIAYNW